jgi:hypothetical protein
LQENPPEKCEMKLCMNEDCFMKAPGMVWHPNQDKFIFEFNRDIFAEQEITERTLL